MCRIGSTINQNAAIVLKEALKNGISWDGYGYYVETVTYVGGGDWEGKGAVRIIFSILEMYILRNLWSKTNMCKNIYYLWLKFTQYTFFFLR